MLDGQYWKLLALEHQYASPEAKAVFRYSALTDFEGVEFVVVASSEDPAPSRSYPNGAILVRCGVPEPAGMPSIFPAIYDGWLPLDEVSPTSVERALAAIDQLVTASAHLLGYTARWVVKYVECVSGQPPTVSALSWFQATR